MTAYGMSKDNILLASGDVNRLENEMAVEDKWKD